MKKFISPFIIIITLLIITGCTGYSYTLIRGQINTTSHSIEGSYQTFDRNYCKDVKFEEGDIVDFKFRLTTDKGTLNVKLYYNDEVITFIEDDMQVTIDKTGTYQIYVFADEHGGSFKVSWEIK